jgi:hypothetical protein
MGTPTAIGCDFGPVLVQGLAELGPFPAPGADLSLELGVSVWLHQSGSDMEDARATMLKVRKVVLQVAGMDSTIEPIPFVGRSRELDLVNMAAYMDNLLIRASGAAGCETRALAERVIGLLRPEPVVPSVAC